MKSCNFSRDFLVISPFKYKSELIVFHILTRIVYCYYPLDPLVDRTFIPISPKIGHDFTSLTNVLISLFLHQIGFAFTVKAQWTVLPKNWCYIVNYVLVIQDQTDLTYTSVPTVSTTPVNLTICEVILEAISVISHLDVNFVSIFLGRKATLKDILNQCMVLGCLNIFKLLKKIHL